MKKIAILTSSEVPELIPDEQLLLSILKSHNMEVDILIWDESYEKLHNYDLVITDFHLKDKETDAEFEKLLE